ncbi:TolC family protein [Tautonia sociabilis]|nr:TolC family protein [Tautonia sociabilis]
MIPPPEVAAPDGIAPPVLPAALPSPEPGRPLVPGQVIYPIDLAGALRLAGARDLDIAIARARVAQAVADLVHARALWLPSLFLGPNWIRHDGSTQIVEGAVRQISKSSLFLGATGALGQGITGPIPAGGPAPVSGTTAVIRISDAIFAPLAARQVVQAERAGVASATNDALLGLAEAYLDLQLAAGRLQIAREAVGHAEELAELTGSFARTGAGLEADHRRALAELERRQVEVEDAVGALEIASAEVVRRTRLDPRIVVAPIEPPESVLRLVADDCPVDDLIVAGLQNRPELAQYQALVEATLVRLKQAKLRPIIPSLALRTSAGGFGGGSNSFFGNFDGRFDTDVNLFWTIEHLGLGDHARIRRSDAERQEAVLRLVQTQDLVAAEVVRADKARLAALRRMDRAARQLPDAQRSLELNLTNIRRGARLPGATRPIEVLQPIQALVQARTDSLEAVLDYNRAQFRLYHAIGRPPLLPPASSTTDAPPSNPFSMPLP